jgi:hypothetical protein
MTEQVVGGQNLQDHQSTRAPQSFGCFVKHGNALKLSVPGAGLPATRQIAMAAERCDKAKEQQQEIQQL